MTTPRLLSSLACTLCMLGAGSAQADLCVIVHPDNPVQSMSPREVSDLFLGRSRSFAMGDHRGGPPAQVYEQAGDSPLRESFFRAVNGMPLNQVNAYWARLRFSGEVLPPVPLADSRAVVETVGQKPNAIGYVDADAVTGAPVKVVLRLKE